jgi:SAM-dependent methyltransferase
MPKTKTIQTLWYDQPRYYDLAFHSDTRPEADFIEAACRKYLARPARRLLEPACGSGRLVAELAGRGYEMAGFDLNQPSLDYLRRRLARRKLKANIFEADMSDFRLSSKADAAFCTFNTFRLLLDERSARRHLECVADALRPGGIYILGFHLLPLDADEESTERWVESQGKTQVTTTLRVLATDRRRRVERLRVSMLVRDRGEEIRFRDEFSFRMYTAAQFRRLLASVPSLELCDVYDFWYEIDNPLKLNDDREDTVFILRKQANALRR